MRDFSGKVAVARLRQGDYDVGREIERAERIGNLSQEVGMSPETVAARVVEGIRTEQFYILTHNHFDNTIRARMEDILQRRTPTPYRSEIDLDARER